MTNSMNGQVALVTGAARGIGLATARRLAEAGVRVFLSDINPETLRAAIEESTGILQDAVVLDVADPDSANRAVARVIAEAGRVDILVNNAGITDQSYPMWETPLSMFHRMWGTHFMGTVHCCQAVIPGMIERGYGRIVNVASVAGKEGNAGSSAYSSAKAGVIGLTKSLGKELARTGVLINAVTPGIINTPLMADATPEHVARLLAKIPMGRPGEADEVAEMIAWLSSPQCSFSTGAVFDISGGRTTY
jgi:3-oxoacyl-[acyl-carrier protein] reductase